MNSPFITRQLQQTRMTAHFSSPFLGTKMVLFLPPYWGNTGKVPKKISPFSPILEMSGEKIPRKSPVPYYEKTAKGIRAHVFVKGQRDSDTLPNKKEAQLWAARRTIELQTIAKGDEGSLRTVQDAFAKYAKEVAPAHKGAQWEEVRLIKLGRDFPRITLDKLNATHIQKWRDARLKDVSPASVLREMKLINSVFEQCRKEWKWVKENPCKDVGRPTAPPHRRTLIRPLQTRKMLRSLGYPARVLPRNAVGHAFLLALLTGMRQGELAALTWDNVHSRYVHLPDTKSDHPRDVPLSKTAVKLLEGMRGYHDTSVFNVTAGAIDVQFRQARTRARLTGFTFHDSRHTAATRIGMSRKLSLEQLCVMFGWSDPKMAMIYFNPTPSDIADLL